MSYQPEICQCYFCGQEFEWSGKGRPRYFCSEDCSRARRFYDAFLRQLDKVNMTDDSRKLMRGEIMQLVNQKFHNNKRKPETV